MEQFELNILFRIFENVLRRHNKDNCIRRKDLRRVLIHFAREAQTRSNASLHE